MLIDCDFMRYLYQDTHQTSVSGESIMLSNIFINTFTLPFMAIEALKPTPDNLFRHHAGHDLECLLNTMLTVCHYTVGPGGKLRQATCEADKKIPLNKWFVQMIDSNWLAPHRTVLAPYWADFAPFLQRLIKATYKEMPYLTADNIATHKAYRDILQEALEKYEREEGDKYAVYAGVPASKRQYEAFYGFHQASTSR